MKNKIIYLTYQNFPAHTANSLQTIANIKHLVKNDVLVDLYFPLRESNSDGDIEVLKNFYQFSENFNVFGLNHPYPHGKIKIFPKLWFHISHYLWAKNTVKKLFLNDTENTFLTRSDWIAYFLAKQGSKVTFECHQSSTTRNLVINSICKFKNVKFVFLNENLQSKYNNVSNSIVLHNAADSSLFVHKNKSIDNKIIFLGNTNRFNKSRGIGQIIKWFEDDYLKENYKLEIVGGTQKDNAQLVETINKLNLSNSVKISSRKDRYETSKILSEFSIGLLINRPDNEHSRLYTSPLKYFEYLYSGLRVIAVDFPAHRVLPFKEKIKFFEYNNKESFVEALIESKETNSLSETEKYSISLENRSKKLIQFLF